MTKQCSTCKKIKPSTEFYKRRKPKPKLYSQCKSCHKIRANIASRNHRKNNPDYNKIWHEKNRDKHRAKAQRRHARIAAQEDTLTEEEWQAILLSYDSRCAYCADRVEVEEEHVIPLVKGGGRTKDNIVPACTSCNKKKSINLWTPLPPEIVRAAV